MFNAFVRTKCRYGLVLIEAVDKMKCTYQRCDKAVSEVSYQKVNAIKHEMEEQTR